MLLGLLFISAQVAITILYTYFLEWFFHIALHDRKRFRGGFKHHFGVHHNQSRKNKMFDKNYLNPLNKESWFEPLGLSLLSIVHFPIFYFFPVVYVTLLFSMLSYYYHHRKAHIDVEWGKQNMPWHYEHHMGKDQHKNWGVRTNIIDKIFNTATEKYESIQ